MFFHKSDLKERIDDMTSTTRVITEKISKARSSMANNSKFLACENIESALKILEETTDKINQSKNLSKNKKDEMYKNSMRSLQVATVNLQEVIGEIQGCESLAPMS